MEHAEPPQRLTRRRLLVAGGGAALGALGLSAAGDHVVATLGTLVRPALAPRSPAYVTRPDLRIPPLSVTTHSAPAAPGLLFLAPYNAPGQAQAGAVIVDDSGEPVWEQPLPGLVTTDFRVQTYRGRPSLTWWEGRVELGHGVGSYVIADTSYRRLASVNAGNGHSGDLHEFLLTDRGTALLTSYLVTRRDLRAVGGSKDGTIQDAMFQEIDIETGRVLLEWHSLDHIPITDSYWPLSTDWDYVHLNSIGVDTDGNLLVSSRNTHTIYKLDRSSGQIIWRMGGKHSDFSFGNDADFAWQHDARRQPDGTITMFDNGDRVSRAIALNLDEARRIVSLRQAFSHPASLYASSQGNVQVLPNGHVLVGWGAQPYVSEFTAAGELIFDAMLAPDYVSYRAFRIPWNATADGAPVVVAQRGRSHSDVYVSWNGDTRVTRWIALTGTSEASLTPIGNVARTGFETAMRVSREVVAIAIRGVDARGTTVGTSALLTL